MLLTDGHARRRLKLHQLVVDGEHEAEFLQLRRGSELMGSQLICMLLARAHSLRCNELHEPVVDRPHKLLAAVDR